MRLTFVTKICLAASTAVASVVVLAQDAPRSEERWLLAALALSLFVFSLFERGWDRQRTGPEPFAGNPGKDVGEASGPLSSDAPARQAVSTWQSEAKDAMAKLRQLEAHRADYVAIVSHELRTPLTSIKGFAQLLNRKELPPTTCRDYAATIVDEADKLARVVDDVLDLTRMETYVLELRRDPIPASDLLLDLAARLRPALASESIKLQLPDRLPWVRGDRERLQQVLARIVLEAVSAARPDTAIHLSAEAADDGVTIWLQYSAVQERIDAMATALEGLSHCGEDGMATRLGRGRLALYISKNLVEAHGGKMWLERTGKEEVRVGVTLPY